MAKKSYLCSRYEEKDYTYHRSYEWYWTRLRPQVR